MDPNNIIESSKQIKSEVRERTLGYILAALGLVAGLAWSDAIKAIIALLFPIQKNSVWAHLAYAILVTIAVVIVATYLTKLVGKKEETNK